jgi:hypothetical protein
MLVWNNKFDQFEGGKIFNDFGINKRDGGEFSGPVAWFVRPGKPSCGMNFPLRGQSKS